MADRQGIPEEQLAQLMLLRRDATAAVNWAQEATHMESNSLRSLGLLGDALVRVGSSNEARSVWLSAAKLIEEGRAGIDRMVASTLGAAESSLKERDPARAERLLRRVIAFHPENAEAHAKMAVAMSKLGFPKSAELWLRRSKELSAKHTEPSR